MGILWHVTINLAVIIASITWAVFCFEEKKPLLASLFLLSIGIVVYGVEIYFGYSDGICPGIATGGLWQRVQAVESCIDSYNPYLLFAQSAIIGSLLVWLFRALGQKRSF